jgi:hypothetical protein
VPAQADRVQCQPEPRTGDDPARAADLIDSLRTADVTLTYDPGQQTLRCNEDIAVTIGNGR